MAELVGRGVVASFAGHQPGKAMLVGLYAIAGAKPLTGRQARAQCGRKLKQALTQTIQVLACAAEHQDAYTARHQQRVADLTVALAYEMNLPSHQIDGLGLGAIVHGIGKLAVPAEIFALPRKLRARSCRLYKCTQIVYLSRICSMQVCRMPGS